MDKSKYFLFFASLCGDCWRILFSIGATLGSNTHEHKIEIPIEIAIPRNVLASPKASSNALLLFDITNTPLQADEAIIPTARARLFTKYFITTRVLAMYTNAIPIPKVAL